MLSFSKKVKEELLNKPSKSRHCALAEIAAYINLCGDFSLYEGILAIHCEDDKILNNVKTLIEEFFQCKVITSETSILIKDKKLVGDIVHATGVKNKYKEYLGPVIDPMVVNMLCCKRAYIKAAFLCSGSVSDPEKGYHLEFVNSSYEHARQLCSLLEQFGVSPKQIERKGHFVVYFKEGEQIVDVLNIISAHSSLLQVENSRVLKEMRNNVNRKVNCETANINKIVSASLRQTEAIKYIQKNMGLDNLPVNLKQMALIRMEYPDMSLKELGSKLDPPIGKSGVNHRLGKLCEIAEQLKGV